MHPYFRRPQHDCLHTPSCTAACAVPVDAHETYGSIVSRAVDTPVAEAGWTCPSTLHTALVFSLAGRTPCSACQLDCMSPFYVARTLALRSTTH